MLAWRWPDVLARTDVTSKAVRPCAPEETTPAVINMATAIRCLSMSGSLARACYRFVLRRRGTMLIVKARAHRHERRASIQEIAMKRHRVGIVLFEDIEVLDFCGPFEVFSVTRINEEKRREEPSPFEVVLIAERPGPVTTTGRMRVIPDYTFENCPSLEIMITPGGWGTRKELTNQVMIEWLRARAAEADIV